MRPIVNIAIVVLFVTSNIQLSYSQLKEKGWFIGGGGVNSDGSNAVEVDSAGNVYITGYFSEEADFGNANNLIAYGGSDVFIAKYNKMGKCLWVKQAGSTFYQKNTISDNGVDLALSNNQYLYVTGSFTGEAVFDSVRLISSGLQDVFLAKYDLDGNLIWARSGGGINQDLSYAIAVDEFGNAFVTGSFQNEAVFNNQSILAENGIELFIAKYDINGNVLWIQQSNSNGHCIGKTISYDKGRLFLSGVFNDKMICQNQVISSNGLDDIFVMCLNERGQLTWLKAFGGEQSETINSIKALGNSLYFTGGFYKEISCGDLSVKSNGEKDVLIGCFNLNGDLLWLNSFGGPFYDEGNSLVLDKEGNVILLGVYQGALDRDDCNIKASGYSDIVLANISNYGTINWAISCGGIGQEIAKEVFYSQGNIYLTGSFMDQLEVSSITNSSNGRADYCLYKFPIDDAKIEEGNILNSSNHNQGIVSISPNPVIDMLNIRSSDEIDFVDIESVDGKQISHSENINSNTYSINLIDLKPGIYVAVVNSCKSKTIRKFVKK